MLRTLRRRCINCDIATGWEGGNGSAATYERGQGALIDAQQGTCDAEGEYSMCNFDRPHHKPTNLESTVPVGDKH